MNAVFKGSSVRRLWYRHLTVFTWEKASSLRWVDKNKKKNLSKEELQIALRRQINSDKDHKAAAIDCLAAPAVRNANQASVRYFPSFCGHGAESRTVVSIDIKVSVQNPSVRTTDNVL